MVSKKVCDKCGAEITTELSGQVDCYVVEKSGAVSGKPVEGIDSNKVKSDLCLECHKEVVKFVKAPTKKGRY